jgi:hypothetical protein
VAISVISSAAANGDSVTIGTHQAGDTIVIAVYRNNSNVLPTVPTGWVVKTQAGSSANALTMATRIAASGAETAGTWTNATQIGVWVLRGSVGLLIYGGQNVNGGTAGSGGSINYPALTNVSTLTNQWILAAAGHRSIDTDIETAPSGLTFRASVVGASAGELSLHDSDGNLNTWSSTNYTLTAGTSSTYRTAILQVCELDYLPAGGGTGGGSLINSQALVRGRVL